VLIRDAVNGITLALDAATLHMLGSTLRHRASDTKVAHHRASELTFLCLGPSLIDQSTSDIAIA
jgi:hypothetical protein